MKTVAFVTCDEFLKATNGRCRARLFNKGDYRNFLEALEEANEQSSIGKSYYASDDAGGVANSYGSVTTTARWGVWTTPDGTVEAVYDRVDVSGRSVKCCYYGGERQYMADWKNNEVKSGAAQTTD